MIYFITALFISTCAAIYVTLQDAWQCGESFPKPSPTVFYILAFTWGLPMTLAGLIAAIVLKARGYKPTKYGPGWHFEYGEGWGGVSLGIIFITSKSASEHVCQHEVGHMIQNIYFGVFMPFVVCIPSVIRYWYIRRHPEEEIEYDSIWFEGMATYAGNQYFKGN